MAKDEDHRRNTSVVADFPYVDTEPFDDTASPSSGEDDVCGDNNECRYFEDTVPLSDDDAALETPAVNLADETQVLEIAGETQVLDDLDTQLLEEGFESDGTQVLEDVDDEVSVDDPQCRDSGQSADCKKVLERSSEHCDKKQTSSGTIPPRFTFLRAESLRKAALANHNMALKQNQDQTNSVMGMGQFCQEPLAVKDNGRSFPGCYEKVREVDQECNLASSAVRKLFNDDLPVEASEPSFSGNDFNEGDNLDKLPINHGNLERLSYVNSQEPGELSQINALDIVDRFLKDNIMEFDQESNHVKNVERMSESLPSTKGQQSLSKRINDRSKATKAGIYDWDDSREDEGGGDIFLRRKEDFFEGGSHRPRSLPGFRKIKLCRPNDDKADEEQSGIPNKRKTAFLSDSKLGMRNLKIGNNNIQEATRKLKRNLADELEEQFNANCSREEMEPNANADGQEMLDVGLDTQIAAEAMEVLCNIGDIVDHVANDTTRITRSRSTCQLNDSSTGKMGPVTSKEHSGQYGRKRKVDVKSDLQTSGLSKKCTKKVGQCKKFNVMSRSKKNKLSAEGNQTSTVKKNGRIVSSPLVEQRKSAGALKRRQLDELNNPDSNDGGSTVNERQFLDENFHFTPVARRTRQSLAVNQSINCDISSKSLRKGGIGIGSHEKNSGIGRQGSKALDPKSTPGFSDHVEVDDNTKPCQPKKSGLKANTVSASNGFAMETLDCPRRRRSLRINKLSNHHKGSEKLVGSSKPSVQAEDIVKSTAGKMKMRTGSVVKSHVNCQSPSSSCGGLGISSTDQKLRQILEPNLDKANSGDTPNCRDVMDEKDANLNPTVKNSADESPRDRHKSSEVATTPVNNASPVCMGDDYYKQSCNKNLSRSCLLKVFRTELHRELRSLSAIRPELITPSKDSRKRKDMTDVRILYSNHLDEDIIKHQKKILARLGVSVVSSIADATHFIADQFVRTRNMLEAIALGKPVVTHLWIESCGQANCFIDERNYILRDAKKEKEFGFSMPVSLARASQHPLLQGRRVLITPNTKPSKEIISSLVMAVQGQAVERVGRSALKDHKIPDDLLILSCEEDYASCVPFLEKGAMVYSSEFLLNGIVTQKLECQRYRLFADHVKKTRSTIWLKRDDRTFTPVTKCS